MTSFQHSDSIVVDATPSSLYELVTDIGRTGEWSPICRACWWEDGDSARVGAWFAGRNEADGRTWDTRSLVEVADPGREFAWLVGGHNVRWGYTMEPAGVDQTRLTESWDFLPAGLAMFAQKHGSNADHEIEVRRQWAVDGIPVTLAGIKRVAEATRDR